MIHFYPWFNHHSHYLGQNPALILWPTYMYPLGHCTYTIWIRENHILLLSQNDRPSPITNQIEKCGAWTDSSLPPLTSPQLIENYRIPLAVLPLLIHVEFPFFTTHEGDVVHFLQCFILHPDASLRRGGGFPPCQGVGKLREGRSSMGGLYLSQLLQVGQSEILNAMQYGME